MRGSEQRFSQQQLRAMLWWRGETGRRYEAVVCDGAIRSGKTFAMGVGFFLWAMSTFDGQQFALCAKTAGAAERNILSGVLPVLRGCGMQIRTKSTARQVVVRLGERENVFWIFGGCDARAAALVQGVTLAGALLDEVVLMPQEFVEQVCARCSAAGSRLWFSCNPDGPQHWFYRKWIMQAEAMRCLYLHFTMRDNPALPEQIRRRYERMYTGVFYRRYVAGLWTAAEGRVYDFFDEQMACDVPDGPWETGWYISCDYGTVNPASFGLWGRSRGVWYRVQEFYYDSRRAGRQMTDAEYAAALRALAGTRTIRAVIVDPSAASFIQTLRRAGWHVQRADNAVLSGIRRTADALRLGQIQICRTCTDCLREMALYVWDSSAARDRVRKQDDHAMDDMRYFVMGVLARTGGFAAHAVARDGSGGQDDAEKRRSDGGQGGAAALRDVHDAGNAAEHSGTGWRAGGTVYADARGAAAAGCGGGEAGTADGRI